MILKGYRTLKADGEVTGEFKDKQLKPMVNALKSYASINRLSEAPDKVSRLLNKDASTFYDFAKGREYDKAMTALEKYKADIPAGVGEFSWDSTLPTDNG